MSIVDPVAEFVRIKSAYMSKRGAAYSTGITTAGGQALIPPSQFVPKTTWGDVTAFGIKFLAWTSNEEIRKCTAKQIADMGYQGGYSSWADLMTSPFVTSLNAAVVKGAIESACSKEFTETSSFRRARDAFVAAMPPAKVYAASPTVGAQYTLALKIKSNEIYPYNEEFWGYGVRYAIARSAAGMVPSNSALFLSSVNEAIDELPATLRNAMKAVVPDIPMPSIPGFGALGAMIKWTLVGTAGYFLYKYWKQKK